MVDLFCKMDYRAAQIQSSQSGGGGGGGGGGEVQFSKAVESGGGTIFTFCVLIPKVTFNLNQELVLSQFVIIIALCNTCRNL